MGLLDAPDAAGDRDEETSRSRFGRTVERAVAGAFVFLSQHQGTSGRRKKSTASSEPGMADRTAWTRR